MLKRLLVDLGVALRPLGVGVGALVVGRGRLGAARILVAAPGLVFVIGFHPGSIPYVHRFGAMIAAAALVAGCGGDDEAEAPSAPPSGTLVVYERGGGIAGVQEELRVERDGRATVTTGGPDGGRATFDLGDAELQRLADEVAAADLSDPPGPPDTACADCFVYRVEAGGRAVEFDEIDQPTESLSALVRHLGAVVAAHAPDS